MLRTIQTQDLSFQRVQKAPSFLLVRGRRGNPVEATGHFSDARMEVPMIVYSLAKTSR